MAFNTYLEGLKIATDLAQRAVLAESSLSSLAPLESPLPTLQKAFPLYISAAEAYSHLTASNLVPETEKAGVKRKWRLVLERAEKVKVRIEELGGNVGKVGLGDEGEEDAIRRRGGRMNGVDLSVWHVSVPKSVERGGSGESSAGGRRATQPDLAGEQVAMDPEWAPAPDSAWNSRQTAEERWVVTQGVGADCSIVAGLAVCLEYNRRWNHQDMRLKFQLATNALYPQDPVGLPRKSETARHVAKLLLNGEWRSVFIDALLPRAKASHLPLHATSHPISPSCPSSATSLGTPGTSADALNKQPGIGPAWIPLAIKAYFLAIGGYSLRGSNPAPDVYAFTGWVPERISLREGFRRERGWTALYNAWNNGKVLVTLGSGQVSEKLVPLHAYAVLDIREENDERILEIFDPGLPAEAGPAVPDDSLARLSLNDQHEKRKTGLFTMTWDEVCAEFDALNLNWNPQSVSITVKRHWSWAKPSAAGHTDNSNQAVESVGGPRFRLSVSGANAGDEIWILLSQHLVSKDRVMDDIAIHVFEDRSSQSSRSTPLPQVDNTSPYSNAQHVLVKHTLRSGSTDLLVLPSRDRGLSRTDFTLQAFAPAKTSLSLERISRSLPFSTLISGSLTLRSAGGHAGTPSFGSNPQYRLVLGNGTRGSGSAVSKADIRFHVVGDANLPWNIKMLWSDGGIVNDVTQDAVIADSGPYSYGLAYAEALDVESRTYTVAVSTFHPGAVGTFKIGVEATMPARLEPIPPEGAGLYHRSIAGKWTEANAAGRPKLGNYAQNPCIDVILPKPTTLHARLHHPTAPASGSVPVNLTLFKRQAGGHLGEQMATSGPYSDTISGVRTPRTKVGQEGVYVLVPSGYERGAGRGTSWRIDVWGDGPFSIEASKG